MLNFLDGKEEGRKHALGDIVGSTEGDVYGHIIGEVISHMLASKCS